MHISKRDNETFECKCSSVNDRDLMVHEVDLDRTERTAFRFVLLLYLVLLHTILNAEMTSHNKKESNSNTQSNL